jgi:D-tyrosyl-tRNA(Tyr) deacylase
MRALVQRVSEASVTVDAVELGRIGEGLCVLAGVAHDDDEGVARSLAEKVWHLRILDDDEGVMNKSLADRATGGQAAEVLVVSQFTLYGDVSRGRRPSWSAAAKPDVAEQLVSAFTRELETQGARVATGRFRAQMKVALVNDGPVTVLLEVNRRK